MSIELISLLSQINKTTLSRYFSKSYQKVEQQWLEVWWIVY